MKREDMKPGLPVKRIHGTETGVVVEVLPEGVHAATIRSDLTGFAGPVVAIRAEDWEPVTLKDAIKVAVTRLYPGAYRDVLVAYLHAD